MNGRSAARELQVCSDAWEPQSAADSSLTEGDLTSAPHPQSNKVKHRGGGGRKMLVLILHWTTHMHSHISGKIWCTEIQFVPLKMADKATLVCLNYFAPFLFIVPRPARQFWKPCRVLLKTPPQAQRHSRRKTKTTETETGISECSFTKLFPLTMGNWFQRNKMFIFHHFFQSNTNTRRH